MAPKLTRRHLLGGLCLLAGALAVGCTYRGNATPPPTAQNTTLGVAQGFRLATLQGGEVSLDDLRGQWVILNFWATWCLPCRAEMPFLQRLADQYAGALTVLAVNMREPAPTVQTFVDELALRFPILMQPNNELLLAYNVRGLPVTYVIAPNGQLARRVIGPLDAESFAEWLLHIMRP